MHENTLNDHSPDVRAEACAWLAQLETGKLSHADLEAFREWVNRSPAHVAEIKLAAQADAELNVLTGLEGPLNQALAQYNVVLDRPKFWMTRPAALAFSFILVTSILVGIAFLGNPLQTPDQWHYAVETATGGYDVVDLPDGSTIEINTRSKVEITFDDTQRSVQLLHGEAIFNVAKDPERPFTVYSGDRFVQAIGTSFLVRNDDIRFEVTVTEGNVYFGNSQDLGLRAGSGIPPAVNYITETLDAGKTTDPISSPQIIHQDGDIEPRAGFVILEAGNRLSMPASTGKAIAVDQDSVESLDDREIARQLAWQDGLLDFSETPLEEVVREVSRYTELSIEIADPELRSWTFGGIFRVSEIQGLFDALSTAYGIDIVYVDTTSVKLTLPAKG